jgi:hypothetical protein
LQRIERCYGSAGVVSVVEVPGKSIHRLVDASPGEWNTRAARDVNVVTVCINCHYNHIGVAIQFLDDSALKISLGSLKSIGCINGKWIGQIRGSVLYFRAIEHTSIVVNPYRMSAPAASTQSQQQQKRKKSQKQTSGTSYPGQKLLSVHSLLTSFH